MSKNKHKNIDFVRNEVERIKGRLSDDRYNVAYSRSFQRNCYSMHDRIRAILRYL